MDSIEDMAHSVVPTLIELMRHKTDYESLQVLESARGTIEETRRDDYDNSYAYYQLVLRVPAALFATIEPRISNIQEKLENQLPNLRIGSPKQNLNSVLILLELIAGSTNAGAAAPPKQDVSRIWKPGKVRLFISHVSAVKVEAAALKSALAGFGVDSFVAHEDIEPTREWMIEIETALKSMDVMCALVTPGFNKSLWTHQEVGFALGRGIPVVLIKAGELPHGLMGKHQALSGDLAKPGHVALGIVTALHGREHTRALITNGLVEGLAHAINYASANSTARLLADASGLSRNQIEMLLDALKTNNQVSESIEGPKVIRSLAQRHGVDPATRKAAT